MYKKNIDIVFENKKYFLPNIFNLVIPLNLALIPVRNLDIVMILYVPIFFYLFFRAIGRARALKLSPKETQIIVTTFPGIVVVIYILGIFIIYAITGFNAYLYIH